MTKFILKVLLIISVSSCNEAQTKHKKEVFRNVGVTFWEIENNKNQIVMLIDSSIIVNVSKYEIPLEYRNSEIDKFTFLIDSFMELITGNNFITDTNNEIEVNFERIDSSYIELNYTIIDESDILELKQIHLDPVYIDDINTTWSDHIESYKNDTMIHFSGQEYGLELDFIHQGKTIYSSVTSIVDTSERIHSDHLGYNLIVKDLNTIELYTIPNFFKNDRQFYPVKFQESNLKRLNQVYKIEEEKIKEYIKRTAAGDTIGAKEFYPL